jgi:quercetin dioxygenase-like cupin family protein
MTKGKAMNRSVLVLSSLLAAGLASAAGAQTNAVHRTPLQDLPFPPPIYHTATIKAVVDPGGEVMPHTHPGVEMAYIASGEAVLTIKGQPPVTLSTGDSFSIPEGAIHSVKNAGTGPLVMISTYVVDKSRPVVQPVP